MDETSELINNFKYSKENMMRSVIMALEGYFIMTTTKNPDIVIGRYKPFAESMLILMLSKTSERYNSDLTVAVDNFKTMYYDKQLTEDILQILIVPEKVGLNNFYAQCLCLSLMKFLEEHKNEIERLSVEKAKLKRKQKMNEMYNLIYTEFNNKCASNKQNDKIELAFKDIFINYKIEDVQ
jgi:hypothetical protein